MTKSTDKELNDVVLARMLRARNDQDALYDLMHALSLHLGVVCVAAARGDDKVLRNILPICHKVIDTEAAAAAVSFREMVIMEKRT